MRSELLVPSYATPSGSLYPAQLAPYNEGIRRSALSSRFVDFWLLGGAAIVSWMVVMIGQLARDHVELLDMHFGQMAAYFGLMQILCNYPHFMMSYRLGYGRGTKFILKHWFALIGVPAALFSLYALAYFGPQTQMTEWPGVPALNSVFGALGLSFRLGTFFSPTTELLSLSIGLMYLTVGWHYAKQVFGCMTVYAHFDRYPLTRNQRRAIKAALFSLALLNLCVSAIYAPEYGNWTSKQMFFFNVPLIPLGLPVWLIPVSGAIAAVGLVTFLYRVIWKNFREHGKLPSLNFLVPWVALCIWYIPYARQAEYYVWMVPFFHSLQYLPFAYRMEAPGIARSRRPEVAASIRIAALILVGFAAFEILPYSLDHQFGTLWNLKTSFFVISFVVFINIHHFFIDSVVWKFDQTEVRKNLLQAS